MKLILNPSFKAHVEILDRVKSLSLAHEYEVSENSEPILIEGSKEFKDEESIANHLDEIAGELHNWYYCNC